tara:strand:+ start:240 stop:557 length:318 start_codon:yes stop_codon:yes gene_type:complete
MNNKIKLKKGDEVIVIAGKDKGKRGKILRVIPESKKIIVSDINKYKKHQKPGNNEPGGIVEKEMPIHISNLSYFDSKSNKGIRIGFKLNKDGTKIRVNKKTGTEI